MFSLSLEKKVISVGLTSCGASASHINRFHHDDDYLWAHDAQDDDDFFPVLDMWMFVREMNIINSHKYDCTIKIFRKQLNYIFTTMSSKHQRFTENEDIL